MADKGDKKSSPFPKEFLCAGSGKPLYMPVVTTNGVAYCYSALFGMFASARGLPICTVTKEQIMFFPNVCLPLHHFLMVEYRSTMRGRKLQEELDMQEKFGLSLPSVTDAPDQDGDAGLLDEFSCVVSEELAYEPCALSSGSIVSAYCVPEGGFKKDPDRLIACGLHGQAPKKSPVLEAMIKAKFSKEYSERAKDLAKQGIQATGKFATGTCKDFDPSGHIFWGLGCDGCGLWPIRGSKAWQDAQCFDKSGFHLCDECFQFGYHRRVIAGRFNQHHMPRHHMVEVPPCDLP